MIRFKNILLLTFSLCTFTLQSCDKRTQNDKTFTIYLVRHAEKAISETSPENPPLTACGKERAQSLDQFLRKTNLDRIYSSDFDRTKSTAGPTSKTKNIKIELYNPGELLKFSKLLLDRKEDALVVGHSNTTPILAGLLAGLDLKEMDEKVYDRIYQVTICNGKGKLQLFQSAFECGDDY